VYVIVSWLCVSGLSRWVLSLGCTFLYFHQRCVAGILNSLWLICTKVTSMMHCGTVMNSSQSQKSSRSWCAVWVKKIPPKVFWHFFPDSYGFFVQILHACYTFLSTFNSKFSFNYLQLWRSYAILSVTTQFTSYVQNVHRQPKCTLAFSDIFPKQLGIFSPNFTRLLYVPIYVRLPIFIKLSPTITKLCQRAFWPMVDILNIWWWSCLI